MTTFVDVSLIDDYKKICNCTDEMERKKKLIKFFKIPLDFKRLSDYKITLSAIDDSFIGIFIKDELTNFTYSANYENNEKLLKYKATHVKHVNVHISYPFINAERELIFSRFDDYSEPLHEEVIVMQDNKFQLTLIKKYPNAYFPYEQGIYLALSEYITGEKMFYKKIFDANNEFFPVDVVNSSFDTIIDKFIFDNKKIFEEIMKKVNH